MSIIRFSLNSATEKELFVHLKEVNKNFDPSLDTRVELQAFSKKMKTHAVCFEAWNGSVLAGLIACYLNDYSQKKGFITHVSVVHACLGLGIASALLEQCIVYGSEHGFKTISLEVNKNNNPAINLYLKFGFQKTTEKDGFQLMELKI